MIRYWGQSVRIRPFSSAKRGVVLAVLTVALLLLGVAPVFASTTVDFPDPALETVVRNALGITVDPITDTDMQTLTYLNGNGAGIKDLTGLEYATSLQVLYLDDNQITDISALAGTTNLTQLTVFNNQVTDISVLAGLTKLATVGLANNEIADIEPLRPLTDLDSAFMQHNRISDISPLADMTKLTYLYVYENFLDITPGSPTMEIVNQQQTRGATVIYSPQRTFFTITPSAGAHGTVSPGTRQFLELDESVTFTITAATGYHVSDVLVDGTSFGALTDYAFTDVEANHTIAAAFAPNVYAIAYNLNGGANPIGAPASYTYGVSLTLPTPTRAGHTFAGWYTSASLTGSPVTAISATDIGDKSYFAKWTAVPAATYQITATAGAGGSITPAGSTNVASGANQSYSITPSTGFKVAAVIVDGTSVGAVTTYTFANVTSNHSISATFAAKTKVSLGTPVAPKTMKRSKYYTVYGSLKPQHMAGTKPVRIYKYKRLAGKWKYMGYVKASVYDYGSQSRYKVKLRLASKGDWRLRAQAPADTNHLKTWSRKYDYVKVK
ncbi:MAG TPA: leucine-rich repeat domain-containing protein [Coriobacteriia bacterium]|nr:leucine-rich repeat domain-containing protein [Coriobacteriia bacterium]